MTLVKMLETRDVAPDGLNVAEWAKGETYDVADPDLLALLLRDVAAEEVKSKTKNAGAAPENK